MNMAEDIVVCAPQENIIKISKWRVREGFPISTGQVILLYELCDGGDTEIKRLKSSKSGVVKKRLYKEGATVEKGRALLELAECIHTTVIKDMCADCGADLRQDENGAISEASVPMVHSVPDLKVTAKLAQKLGQADTKRLLEDKKLVLLVDLDQTIIHTTNDNVPSNIKGIYHFQLYGPNSPWYHTRLRPGTLKFLSNIAVYFELHICTFGARNYAHTIAQYIDPDGKYFSHRILSRDECFNVTSKTDNLKALFPCGDSMVCIIDDREDVWNMASNLIQVKPYHFFQHTGDINAPPGLSKHELDGNGMDFKDFNEASEADTDQKEKMNSNQDEVIMDEMKSVSKENSDDKIELSTELHEQIIETVDNTNTKNSSLEIVKEEIEKNAEQITRNANEKDVVEKKKLQDSNKNEKHLEEKLSKSNENMENCEKFGCEDNKLKASKETFKKPKNILLKSLSKNYKNFIEIEDPDDYLLYLEVILKTIHSRFYSIYEETKEIPDLKMLIPTIRTEVLRGATLVFSGLVPNHMKLEQSRAYMIARSLGASVSQHLSDETTHLVAMTAGTLKVNAARSRIGVSIVTPDWLWCCAERWEHVPEKLFPLDPNKPSKMRQPPPHCHSPEHVINYNVKINTTKQSIEPKFIDTINPLLSFSNTDLAEMNEDFDQFFESDSSSDDEPVNIENPPLDKILRKRKWEEEKEERQRNFFSRNENEVLISNEDIPEKETNSSDDDDEMPSAKFRRGEALPSDLDVGSGSESNGSEEPIDEEDDGKWNMMCAELEREFLGLD